jgi:hypothetical protein
MNTVIAAVGNDAAARSVLGVAAAAAHVLDADVDAVHVGDGSARTAAAAARSAGVPLRTLRPPVAPALIAAARGPTVRAFVLGLRGAQGGARPFGRVVGQSIVAISTPVVLVPPETPTPFRLHRVLVPMEGSADTSASMATTLHIVHASDIEVTVLRVLPEAAPPLFEDQPQHETEAWAHEFLARYVPIEPEAVRFEMRMGAPSQQVLAGAGESVANMIALGWGRDLSHGHAAKVREVLSGSPIPILLLPCLFVRSAGIVPAGARRA